MAPSTVTKPSKLNQAVRQPVNRLPRIEPQWYSPPADGKADAICAIAKPKQAESITLSGQLRPIAAPPTPLVAWAIEVMPPARMQIMENEIAKFEKRLSRRASSWA